MPYTEKWLYKVISKEHQQKLGSDIAVIAIYFIDCLESFLFFLIVSQCEHVYLTNRYFHFM